MVGMGRPRMARTCKANSDRFWGDEGDHPRAVRPGARPRRRGPGLLTNSSTPKMSASRAAVMMGPGDAVGSWPGPCRSWGGPPGIMVVAFFLPVADGRAAARPAGVPHGQERDLAVERRILPRSPGRPRSVRPLRGVVLVPFGSLVFGRATFCPSSLMEDITGLDHAGCPIVGSGGQEFILRVGEAIGEVLRLRSSAARRRMPRGPWSSRPAVGTTLNPSPSRASESFKDGFQLGHDEVGPLLSMIRTQGAGVEHVHDMLSAGDLHGRRVRVAVHGDDLDAEPLGSMATSCSSSPVLPPSS